MENQDFNKELLDYLYGEMTALEKKEFEQKLQTDEALKSELEELSVVRGNLSMLKEKEVMEPFSAWSKSRSSGWFNKSQKRKMIVFRPITAVAASLVLLMLVGYLTKFSMSIHNTGVTVGFANQASVDGQSYLSMDDVKSIVKVEVQKSNELLLSKLASSEQILNSKLTSLESNNLETSDSKSENALTSDDLKEIFELVENRNATMMKEYLKLTSSQQQEYFKTMLTQFNAFYQEQREDDLAFVQASLVEMQQNQTIQKQETDQAIASLYTSVRQKGK